jgi:hypothetical protein
MDEGNYSLLEATETGRAVELWPFGTAKPLIQPYLSVVEVE